MSTRDQISRVPARRTLPWLSAALLLTPTMSGAAPGDTHLVSAKHPDIVRASANAFSGSRMAISVNGRFIAFESLASDLVEGDTNRSSDVFVYDRTDGNIERVSVASDETQGNANSSNPSISNDGRLVAFESRSRNLIESDTNGEPDVFIHDRHTGITTRVSVSSSGAETFVGEGDEWEQYGNTTPAISGDGRYVAFQSAAWNLDPSAPHDTVSIYVHDRVTGQTRLASVNSNGEPARTQPEPDSPWGPFSGSASISADGRFVAFSSDATDLVPGDTNATGDVFIHDRHTGETTLVSRSSSGEAGNAGSDGPSISGSGRFVAFSSSASNLVPGDTNLHHDVFVHDLQTGSTHRVSTGLAGQQTNSGSGDPSISSDGRIVAFLSRASNIVPGDTNDVNGDDQYETDLYGIDVFVKDLLTGATVRASVTTSGAQANADSLSAALSGHGRFVAFTAAATNLVGDDNNHKWDAFIRDRQAPATTLVSQAKIHSSTALGASESGPDRSVSSTGRFVAFASDAEHLVEGDTNQRSDVFVRDRQTGITTRVSVGPSGLQPNNASFDPSISGSGRFVSFYSYASNLIAGDTNDEADVFVHDRQTRTTTRISVGPGGLEANGDSTDPSISNDGRFVAYSTSASNLAPGDSNNAADVLLHDRQTGTTRLVSIASNGTQGDSDSTSPSVSNDGRIVAFVSRSSTLASVPPDHATRVFLRDMGIGGTELVSVGTDGAISNGSSSDPTISANGELVAFVSSASNLVPDLTGSHHVFLRDRRNAVTSVVSVNSNGEPVLYADSTQPSISANGRYIAFTSTSDGIFPGDNNQGTDVFVHDRQTATTVLVSAASDGTPGERQSSQPAISGNGQIIVFTSDALNLVPDDANGDTDVFARERPLTGTVLRINAGGPVFTDSLGRQWAADAGFNTGGTATRPNAIAGTLDDALYQTERWDAAALPELRYNLPVPNGSYLVRLHFAENHAPNFGVGRRVFDVNMEGVRRFEDIDVFAEAGAQTVLVRSTTVDVSDGQLTIVFQRQTQNPFVNAIEVIAQQP